MRKLKLEFLIELIASKLWRADEERAIGMDRATEVVIHDLFTLGLLREELIEFPKGEDEGEVRHPVFPVATEPAVEFQKEIAGTFQDSGLAEGLEGLDIGNFLSDTPQAAQRAWIRAHGLDLVRSELPLAWAAWESNTERHALGGKAVFIRRWFQNAAADRSEKLAKETHAASPAKGFGSYDSIVREGEAARLSAAEEVVLPSPEKVREFVKKVTGNL